MPLPPGTTLGPYRILSQLGAGGMGEVYLASDTRLNRRVAVKILPPDLAREGDRLARFEREAQAAAGLSHPHIAQVFDIDVSGPVPYFVQEHLEGTSLGALLRTGPMPVRRALDLGIEIAEALAAAHGAGVVHRDLKPDNVFVSPEGHAKVLDFGLARFTSVSPQGQANADTPTVFETGDGRIFGTPGYMAPEQIEGRETVSQSDQFAFGAMLYEMVTGRRPFAGDSSFAVLTATVSGARPDLAAAVPGVPPSLAVLVQRCLEKRPEARFRETRQLVDSLRRAREELTASVVTPATGRRRRWAVAGGAGVLALVALLALWPWPRTDGTAPPKIARLSQLTTTAAVEQDPAWSPDGHQLAYARHTGESRKLFVLDTRTGTERQVTTGAQDDIQPAWSHDGRRLLFVRSSAPSQRVRQGDVFGVHEGGDIWSVDLDSGGTTKLLSDAFNPAVSPDGARIAFDASWGGSRRIWIANAQGQNPRQASTDSSEAVEHIVPRWSPDGGRLVFERLERTGFDLATLELESGRMHVLMDDSFVDLYPVWSAEGDAIYFSSARSGGMNLWRVPIGRDGAAAGPPQQVTTGAGQDVQAAPAPGGRRVAFVTLTQNSDLWRLPLDETSGVPRGAPEALVQSTREDRVVSS